MEPRDAVKKLIFFDYKINEEPLLKSSIMERLLNQSNTWSKGDLSDIVLGFDTILGYESSENPYFGATCGRYANRLKNGSFILDGMTYQLAKNDGENALHGGMRGFDKQVWEARVHADSLILKHRSPDGDEGYPGTLLVEVTFQLTEKNDLRIDYQAETDQAHHHQPH